MENGGLPTGKHTKNYGKSSLANSFLTDEDHMKTVENMGISWRYNDRI